MALTTRPLRSALLGASPGPGACPGESSLGRVEVSAEQAHRGAGGDIGDQPTAPRLLTAPSGKRDRIIQIFRKSEIVEGGNSGLYTLSLPRACLNVGALTTAHPAERKEDSLHLPNPAKPNYSQSFPKPSYDESLAKSDLNFTENRQN